MQKVVHQTQLPVIGELPSGLDGAFCRVGPNPNPSVIGGDYHWCVHACLAIFHPGTADGVEMVSAAGLMGMAWWEPAAAG